MMAGMGYDIIDADAIAHEVLDIQSREIEEIFGSGVITEGKVDRKALGAIVFADSQQRKKLEELVHPLIQRKIENISSILDELKKPYLIDIPLFYERGSYSIEKVIVVYVPRDLQINRLMQRNGLSKVEALQRIGAQMDIQQKRAGATYLIDNTGDLKHLRQECKRVDGEITSDFVNI